MDVRELAVQKKRELKGFLTVGTKYELKDAHDLSVAYTPGVAEPCLRIKDNEAELSEREIKQIKQQLKQEMMEIFYGRNLPSVKA